MNRLLAIFSAAILAKCSLTRMGLAGLVVLASALGASAKVIDFVGGKDGEYVAHPIYDAPEAVGRVDTRYCSDFDYNFCASRDGFSHQWSYYEDHPGISLDDDGIMASYAYRDDFGRFSVRSVDLRSLAPGGGAWITGSGPAPSPSDWEAYVAWLTEGGVYEGIAYGLYGYRNGIRVGSYEFGVGTDVSLMTRVALGLGFQNIDAIKFAIGLPFDQMYGDMNWVDPDRYGMVPPPNSLTCLGEYCDAFSVTSMKVTMLTPIPVPASGLLLGGVLMVGAGVAHRRKRKQRVG